MSSNEGIAALPLPLSRHHPHASADGTELQPKRMESATDMAGGTTLSVPNMSASESREVTTAVSMRLPLAFRDEEAYMTFGDTYGGALSISEPIGFMTSETARGITLLDLQSTWTLFFLRIFHAWVFLVATMMLAGFGLNTFLTMFLEFAGRLATSHRLLRREDWLEVVRLGTRALLLVYLFAGLVQRGFWLASDCFAEDMFLSYRRVLCFEGAGPGEWFAQTLRVRLATPEERASLVEAVDSGTRAGRVIKDVKIGTVQLFKGWELLASPSLQCDDIHEEILTMALPAELVFSSQSNSVRTAALVGSDYRGTLRARWDMICQVYIFLSLDVLPFFGTLMGLGPGSFVSMDSMTVLASRSIAVASWHIICFFVFSTATDYYWKVLSWLSLEKHFSVQLCAIPAWIHRWYEGHTLRSPDQPAASMIDLASTKSKASRNGDSRCGAEESSISGANDYDEISSRVIGGTSSISIGIESSRSKSRVDSSDFGLGTSPTMNVSPSRMRFQTHVTQRAAETTGIVDNGMRGRTQIERRSDDMNLIVVLRRLLTFGQCHVVLVVWVAVGVGLYMISSLKFGWIGKVQLASIGIAIVSLVLLFRYRLAHRMWKGRDKLKSVSDLFDMTTRTPGTVRSKCFQRNCGMDPQSVLCNAWWQLAGFSLLAGGGIAKDMAGYSVLGILGGIWSLCIIVFSLWLRQHLWMISLIQTTIFGLCALGSAMIAHPKDLIGFGYDSTILLMIYTQLGNWRMGKMKVHVCMTVVYLVAAVLIALITMIAHSDSGGRVFGNPPLEGCLPDEVRAGTCVPIRWNVTGFKPAYNYCGLSWLMGWNGTDGHETKHGTVSERCIDTKLGLTDFGQISTVAGYLPNLTKVNLALDMNLPGWKPVYHQVYNISEGKRNTFIHVNRGMTHIVAVRGTSSAVEALQDINLWMPVAFVQLANSMGPTFYSTKSVLATLTHGSREMRGEIMKDLVRYVKDLKDKYSGPGYKLYITGHSLGGGLATAVGAAFNIPAVTFSAPGLRATATILEPQPLDDALIRESVNVVPDRDPVPTVDEQTGAVLHVKCPLASRISCHRLMVTMCELIASCGDGAGRGIPRGYQRSCGICAGVAGLADTLQDQCEPQATPAPPSDK